MSDLTYELLLGACLPGGSTALTSRTNLEPAAGPLAGVAPARFVEGRNAVYAYEKRFDGEDAVTAVVLLSKGAALNKVEAALATAMADGVEPLARTPRVNLTYVGLPSMTELDLPHRVFDGHLRAGTIGATPTTEHPVYRALRDATPANARPLLEASPVSLVLGAWDSTRKAHQGRYRSALTGEIIGVLADQSADPITPRRGAARTDTVAPSVRLPGKEMESLLEAQGSELSTGNIERIRKAIAKGGKTGTVSGAALGLGSVPPSMEGLGFVSCRRIVRHHVLTFAALRQLRFGLGPDGDAAARALLAALALAGLARSDAELEIRANCDLVESAPPSVELDARYGAKTAIQPLDIATTDVLLSTAIDAVTARGVRWEGQHLDVVGDPLIAGGIEADTEE